LEQRTRHAGVLGRFRLYEYIGHLIGSLDALGGGTHVVAVCQFVPGHPGRRSDHGAGPQPRAA
jgi:hypothetical protein